MRAEHRERQIAEHRERQIIVGTTHYLVARGDKRALLGFLGFRKPDQGQITREAAGESGFPIGRVKISIEDDFGGVYKQYPEASIVIGENGEAYLLLKHSDLPAQPERDKLTPRWFADSKELRDKVRLVER